MSTMLSPEDVLRIAGLVTEWVRRSGPLNSEIVEADVRVDDCTYRFTLVSFARAPEPSRGLDGTITSHGAIIQRLGHALAAKVFAVAESCATVTKTLDI
jgi:hypothetical protein